MDKLRIFCLLLFLEYAFPEDTFIVGDGGCQFLYRSDSRISTPDSPNSSCAAVALVFTRDTNKPLGEFILHFGFIIYIYVLNMMFSKLASVSNITIVCLYSYWQILEKLNSMSCYLLAYHQSAPCTRQLLLNVGKVLLGSLHLEKEFVGILTVKLF